jgi:O-succinylhomoserine sulfhydrylase
MNDTPYRPRTRLVHEGQRRSRYGETSEAIYLTQGFVYPDAEAAEARFKGELAEGEEGFIYARYGNPTATTRSRCSAART